MRGEGSVAVRGKGSVAVRGKGSVAVRGKGSALNHPVLAGKLVVPTLASVHL